MLRKSPKGSTQSVSVVLKLILDYTNKTQESGFDLTGLFKRLPYTIGELQLRQQSEWTHNLIEKGVLDKHPRLVAKLWTWINHCQPETFSCFCCCCCFRHSFILFLFFSLLFAAVVLKKCIRRSTVYFPHNCLFTPVFGHKKAKWFDCIAIMWKKSSNMLSLTFTSYNFELTFQNV